MWSSKRKRRIASGLVTPRIRVLGSKEFKISTTSGLSVSRETTVRWVCEIVKKLCGFGSDHMRITTNSSRCIDKAGSAAGAEKWECAEAHRPKDEKTKRLN